MPRGDICSAANCRLFDHLVGADEQVRRDFEVERPGGSQLRTKLATPCPSSTASPPPGAIPSPSRRLLISPSVGLRGSSNSTPGIQPRRERHCLETFTWAQNLHFRR